MRGKKAWAYSALCDLVQINAVKQFKTLPKNKYITLRLISYKSVKCKIQNIQLQALNLYFYDRNNIFHNYKIQQKIENDPLF